MPILEVYYGQEISTVDDTHLGSSAPGEWIFEPGLFSREFWTAHRRRDRHVQTLTLIAHRPPLDFRLMRDDRSVHLYRQLLKLEPLESDEEIELYFGWAPADHDKLYIRQRGPQYPLFPLGIPHALDETLEAWDLGLEDVSFDSWEIERWWWVAYLPRVDQDSIQSAYKRLIEVHYWLSSFSLDMQQTAIESLGSWLAERVR